MYPDVDACSTSPRSSLSSLSPASLPPSFSPPSSSSPSRRPRRLALSAPPSTCPDDDPHSYLFRHFSLSLALPTPSHRHFLLSSLLSSHPFFLLLHRHTRRRLFDEFTRHSHCAHTQLLRQGQPCDRFSVVESGEVSVGGSSTAGRGYTWGDLCLYHPTRAHSTVTAASPRLVVWSVDGDVVRYQLCKEAKERHELLVAYWTAFTVEGVGGRRRLRGEEVEALVDRCDLRRYEEGDWIIPSSQSRLHLFAVKEGQVAIHPPTPLPPAAPLPSALLGPGRVFAGEQVSGPSKGALPRQPSPIPLPVAKEEPTGAHSRRKRGREELAVTPTSALSTIYECEGDDGQAGDGRSARKLRRQQSECVLPTAPSFACHRPVSCASPMPRGRGVAGEVEEVGMALMKRSVSSPAQFVTAGMWGGVEGLGTATPFAVCASATATVVAIPLEALEGEDMADVRRTLQSHGM